MRITAVVILILLAALAASNPNMEAFEAYTEVHAERLLLKETGDTRLGRVLSKVGGSLAGALVEQVSERDNYLVFSVYTIDLDGDDEDRDEWRFLGVAGRFFEIQKPDEGRERDRR